MVEKSCAGFERERRRAYYAGRRSGQGKREHFRRKAEPSMPAQASDFAAEQLKLVSKASFASRSLLNKSEATRGACSRWTGSWCGCGLVNQP